MSSQGLIGRIGVELYADLARFTGDLGKADKQARDFVGGITGQFSKVQGAIAGLGATLGVLGFAKMVDDVAKARASLDDLADSGLGSVESLSKLQQNVKAYGGDFDGLTSALGRMVKGLAGSDKETSKAGEALRRLGIDARDSSGALKEPAAIFDELAVELAKYKDGADKAAYAQAILGNGGEKYLPLLKDMAEYGSKSAKVTKEQAEEADKYDKALRGLSISLEGSTKRIAGEFIPVVTALAGAFTDLLNENNGVKKAVGDLAADGTLKSWAFDVGKGFAFIVDAGTGVVRTFEIVGKAIGETARNAVDFGKVALGAFEMTNPATAAQGFERIKEGFSGLKTMGASFKDDLDQIANRAWFSDRFTAKWKQNIEATSAAAKRVTAQLNSEGLGDKDKKEPDEFAKAWDAASKRVALAFAEMQNGEEKLTASERLLIELRGSKVWEQFTTEQRISLRVLLEQGAAFDKVGAAQIEAAKAQKEYTDALRKTNDGISEQITQAQTSIETYGMSKSAVLDYSAALLEQQAATLTADEATKEQIALLTRKAELLRELAGKTRQLEGLDVLRKQGEETLRFVDQLATDLGNLGGAFSRGMKSGWDAVRNYGRQVWQDILALFTKKIVLNIVAGVTGSGSVSALAANAGNGSVGGSILNLLSGAGGIGSSIGSLIGGGAGVAAPGMGLAAGVESLLLNTTGSVGLASAGGSIASMISAAGPYAAALAAAYALYKAFAPARGGPKEGGGFAGMFGGAGNMLSGANNGWYAVNTHNDMVQQIVNSTGAAIGQMISRFGGSSSGFNLALGYDTDPKGTAPNRIKTDFTADGRTIYASDYTLARGDPGPQLQLEMARVMVEALKNSNIDSQIRALFDSFDLSNASLDGINALMAQAEDLNSVLKGLAENTIGGITLEAVRAAQVAGESLGQTFSRMVGEFQRVEAAVRASIEGIWQSATSALGGQFASTFARGRLEQTYAKWQAMRGENFSWDEMLAHFKLFTPELLQGGIDATRTQYGAEGVALLQQLWADYASYVQAMGQGAQQVTTSFTDVATGVGDFGARLADLRSGLVGYLNGLNQSNLSPFDAGTRYKMAADVFWQQLGLAEGGNLDALAGIQGYHQAFLTASQGANASNPLYVADYMSSYNRLNSLTGNQAQLPLTAAVYTAAHNETRELLTRIGVQSTDTNRLLTMLANSIDAEDGLLTKNPELAAAVGRLALAVETPVKL